MKIGNRVAAPQNRCHSDFPSARCVTGHSPHLLSPEGRWVLLDVLFRRTEALKGGARCAAAAAGLTRALGRALSARGGVAAGQAEPVGAAAAAPSCCLFRRRPPRGPPASRGGRRSARRAASLSTGRAAWLAATWSEEAKSRVGPWLPGARRPARVREEAGSAEPGTGGARGPAAVGAPRERTRQHARPPAAAAAARLRRARREYARLRGSRAGWGDGGPQIFRWGVGALPPHASPTATISLRSSPEGPLLQNTIGVSAGAGSAEITPLPSSPPLPPGCASGALLGGALEPPLAVRFVCRALCLRYCRETSSSPLEVDVFTLTLRTRKARLGKTKNLAPRKDNWNPIRLLQSLDICTHTGLRMGRPPKALAAAAAGSVMGPGLQLFPSPLLWVWLPSVCVSGDSWEQLVSPNQAQGGAGREKRRQQSGWRVFLSFSETPGNPGLSLRDL